MKKYVALAALLLVTACSSTPDTVQKQSTGEQMRINNYSNTDAVPRTDTNMKINSQKGTFSSSLTYPYGQPDNTMRTRQAPINLPDWLMGRIQIGYPDGNTNDGNYGNGIGNGNNAQNPTYTPAPTATDAPNTKPNTGTNQGTGDFEQEVLKLVNAQRQSAGLGALSMDAKLANMAMVKAKDMYDNNYFDHNSPTYGSPFDMMRQFGITYQYAGENIAKGQPTPQQVMTDWMNSPGHRANILKSSFTKIGVAYYKGEWVQEFIG
ncbi:CAP domain-containing protein [Paenibacillus harenae]|uniref:YkwD family protein n=1 Tax=Paenibacillus harenae TaxID=306543 RepID=A0ABT9U4T6_PAEHA|nr:CAP domain-containing protein [Paenibacillus harenae]MDQ0114071.1 putative YkwD family protein [Paenibacillus harenae]